MDISARHGGDSRPRFCRPLLLASLSVFYQVVFILFIAIVLGTVIRPAATWFNHRGLSRLAGVVLVYLLILAFFIGFVFLLFPLIAKQGATIAAAFQDTTKACAPGWLAIPIN